VQGAKNPGVSGCNILCNLTKLIFELIKSDCCGGLAVSEDVVSKKTGISVAEVDDEASGPL
jgi:hypothetical protein